MRLLNILDKVMRRIAPGPVSSFNEVHVLEAIAIIGESPIGRAKLAKELSLGEGVIRTLLKHLQKEELIKTTRSGCVLTELGVVVFTELRSKVAKALEVPQGSYSLDRFNVAVLVKGAANALESGVEQRDEAIKFGAKGVTTLVFTRGRLVMPGVRKDPLEDEPQIRDNLVRNLKPKEGDVMIIGYANDRKLAEWGAKAAALKTLRMFYQSQAAFRDNNESTNDSYTEIAD